MQHIIGEYLGMDTHFLFQKDSQKCMNLPELSKAVSIYKNVGFEKLNQAMGNSGHCGCDIWMLKKL